jgi:hypothetical protein
MWPTVREGSGLNAVPSLKKSHGMGGVNGKKKRSSLRHSVHFAAERAAKGKRHSVHFSGTATVTAESVSSSMKNSVNSKLTKMKRHSLHMLGGGGMGMGMSMTAAEAPLTKVEEERGGKIRDPRGDVTVTSPVVPMTTTTSLDKMRSKGKKLR